MTYLNDDNYSTAPVRTFPVTCPICGTRQQVSSSRGGPHSCSIACYQTGNDQPPLPSRHDTVTTRAATTACPRCHQPFTPVGRQIYCTDACRAAAYRRRRDADRPAVTVPPARPRKLSTVYECTDCGTRALGEQRCDDCGTFMNRVGYGGVCPCCDEPITVNELVDQEAAP